jgi:hypothetical protein
MSAALDNYNMSLFLTFDELRQLTDRARASAQIRWLKAHGFPFEISAEGKPKVLRSVCLARCGEKRQTPAEPRLRLA